MATFIVKKMSSTPDGSTYGAGIVMIHAPSAEAAKIQGANDLGVHPTQVTVTPYNDPHWAGMG